MDYEPRGAAHSLFLDRGQEVAMVGAAGTGKTVAALMKLHLTCLMVPGVQALVVRQTHASLTASTLVAFEQFVAAQELASGKTKWYGGSASKPAGYRYPNGSMIMVGGMDKPGKVLSMSLDRVLIDEANQVSIIAYETLLTRLRGSAATYKQMVTACNPDHPDHWLKLRADDPDTPMRMYTSLHQDNPYLFRRNGIPTESGVDYLNFLGALTGIRRERYLEGRWVAAEGLIYDQWRAESNVIPRSTLPPIQRHVWTIDFGFQNQFVWQCWGLDADDRAYLLHEISHRQKLVEDHARDIKQIAKDLGLPRPEAVVCDHDSEDRATFTRHIGLPTVAAKKAVSPGIQAMEARIRKQPDGRPRIFVVDDAILPTDPLAKTDKRPRGLAAEIMGYVWAVERGADGIPKEVPVKLNDHSMDAARYLCAYLDLTPPAKAGNPARAEAAQPKQGSVWNQPVGR